MALATIAAHALQPGVRASLINHMNANPNPPQIGSTPPNFNPSLERLQHIDILKLIFFYNEDFGIVQGDVVEDRINKFRAFLTAF